uniref:Putative secreted protein n=1 Tax=Anopheles triannulatus TaxID=58253 RepID=A0A2M4B5T5_9DIPT
MLLLLLLLVMVGGSIVLGTARQQPTGQLVGMVLQRWIVVRVKLLDLGVRATQIGVARWQLVQSAFLAVPCLLDRQIAAKVLAIVLNVFQDVFVEKVRWLHGRYTGGRWHRWHHLAVVHRAVLVVAVLLGLPVSGRTGGR